MRKELTLWDKKFRLCAKCDGQHKDNFSDAVLVDDTKEALKKNIEKLKVRFADWGAIDMYAKEDFGEEMLK